MERIKKILKPGKKKAVGLAIALALAAGTMAGNAVLEGGKTVDFTVLGEKQFPREISGDVIPEYRDLERALACRIDDKIYVIVTRGEKTSTGYKVEISKIKLKTEEDKETLLVYASFKEPAKGTSMSQVLTYPLEVVETDLKKLPDEIELIVRFEE